MRASEQDEIGTRLITRSDAESFLYNEAALIDSRDFNGWLELFTDDALYWVPNVVEDPAREPSILYENKARIEERVYRLLETPAYAQIPPSRTIRTVSNVRVAESGEETATLLCNTVIHEMRLGDENQVGLGEPRWFAASCQYDLKRVTESWRISLKKVWILQREAALYNLTFIL